MLRDEQLFENLTILQDDPQSLFCAFLDCLFGLPIKALIKRIKFNIENRDTNGYET